MTFAQIMMKTQQEDRLKPLIGKIAHLALPSKTSEVGLRLQGSKPVKPPMTKPGIIKRRIGPDTSRKNFKVNKSMI